MDLKTVKTCPLGSKCQTIVGEEIHQCAWFIKLAGMNPNTGEQLDEYGCSMTWLPILLVENSNTNRSTSSAVESLRNEVVRVNADNQQLLVAAQNLQNAKLIT